jgi:fibronectin-binding autotransporter adhesin
MAASPLSTTTATPQTITSQVTHNGLLAATGGLTFTGGTLVPGSVYSDSNYGAIVMGHSGTVADVALRSHGGTIGVQMDTSGNVTLPVSLTVGSPTITLSGTQVPSQIAIIAQNYAGTTTASGTLNNLVIGSASDTLTAPNAYLVDLAVNHNVGAGWDGSRGGVQVQLNQVAASTSTLPLGAGLVGMTSNVVSNFNAGGVSTGFGTTAFGKGQLFGMTLRPVLEGGATYFTGCTGLEIDNECDAGSSVASNVGMQIVHEGPHAVQGTVADIAFRFGDQPAALVGWKDLITAGDYASQWPVDANGYIFSVHSGFNYGSFPALAAGGVDLLQATFSGTREAGGGFAFRTSGPSGLGATAVDLNGVLKVGTGTLTAVSGGVTLDTPSYVFSAVASIVSGGANFTSGDLVLDGYGNLFAVTASAGVVSALTLKKTAEGRSAAPSGTINCKSVTRTGSSLGTGLQITETWVQAKTINIGTSVATAVNIGNASSTTTITGALAASNALTVTGQTTCNGGIAFSGGALTAGSIYTDTNFGCLIKTHGGTVADFCVETSGGTNALEISTAGVVSVLAGLVVTGGISMAAGSNLKNNGLAVVGARQTGWVAMTGTTDIATSFATSTVTLIQLAERVAAIQAAITTHGLIGT